MIPSEKMVMQYAGLITEMNNLDAERDATTKRLQISEIGYNSGWYRGGKEMEERIA